MGGYDGGIKISKISDIKNNWPQIRNNLIKILEDKYLNCSKWEEKFALKYAEDSKKLPKDISNLSNKEICDSLSFIQSVDCPYLLDDYIITAVGDYVPSEMKILSDCLIGEEITTWT